MVKLEMERLVGRREDRLSLCDDAQEGREQQKNLPCLHLQLHDHRGGRRHQNVRELCMECI